MAWQQSPLRRNVEDEGGGSANEVFMRAGKNAEKAGTSSIGKHFFALPQDCISIGKLLQGTSAQGTQI